MENQTCEYETKKIKDCLASEIMDNFEINKANICFFKIYKVLFETKKFIDTNLMTNEEDKMPQLNQTFELLKANIEPLILNTEIKVIKNA